MSFQRIGLWCVVFCLVTPGRAAAASNDADFLQRALQNEVGQYDIGLIGERKASASAVKAFATRLADEGSSAVTQLKKIARVQRLSYDEDAELRAKAQYTDLEARKGSDFDQTLAHDAMIDANIEIDTFSDEAQHGSDPALRQFAAIELAKLRGDLKMSQDLGG
jgi:putative membrane protein